MDYEDNLKDYSDSQKKEEKKHAPLVLPLHLSIHVMNNKS